jgi:integrase
MGSLAAAHKGYLYQDIATAYFLARGLVDPVWVTTVDWKFHPDDRFDDLLVAQEDGRRVRLQFKHSDTNVIFSRSFLNSERHALRLDRLIHSWRWDPPQARAHEYRICVTWHTPTEPDDVALLVPLAEPGSFAGASRSFRLAVHTIWPKRGHPLLSSQAWLAKINAQRLDKLTTDSIIAWRNAYVAKGDADPMARKSAERSAASYLRCARSLFTRDVIAALRVKLPMNPFVGVKLKDPGPQRYHSDVSAEWLLKRANQELRNAEPQQFLALFLCLWAGLRRKEADVLMKDQVDFKLGQVHVRRIPYFEPKTEESLRVIDLAPNALAVLQTLLTESSGEFVLAGAEPNPAATYDYYRCDCTWRALHEWLRGKGVRERKAIHALRKESGSLIASNLGIEAARQHLGHRNIRTTSSHYVEKRRRIEVNLALSS